MRTAHKAREISARDIPTDRPVITLDVDGVLNAFDHDRGSRMMGRRLEEAPVPYRINHSRKVTLPAEMCHQHGYGLGKSFRITWSDDCMADILSVAKSGMASIVWLTSWNEFADFLGWRCFWRGEPSPAIGYIDCTTGGMRSSYVGKLLAFFEVCEAMSDAHPDGDIPPVIAIDDDSPWTPRDWYREGGDDPLPDFFHGVATDPCYGLTRSQWEDVLGIFGDWRDGGRKG